MSVNEKVLDAIELLTKNSVQKAKYDKTIQAQILSCEDSTIGKYRCRYQDATFYAYSSNLDLTFSKGSEVYVFTNDGFELWSSGASYPAPEGDQSSDVVDVGEVDYMILTA